MKILVVGSGGREHALVWKLAQEACAPQIFCAPGNAGTAALARNIPIQADNLPELLKWAGEHRPDLTVVGPEAPLCLGIVDHFMEAGLAIFGPVRDAARLEGSKQFAKEIMRAAGVPTARSCCCTTFQEGVQALDGFSLPVVIKADGLAAGKGVVIASTRQEGVEALDAMLVGNCFGASGARVVIEEFLEGEELSILALVDGERAVLLPSSQDHKRIFDHDRGPNTGGMGAYSPVPLVKGEMLSRIKDGVILPVIRELKKRGIVYKGVLYAGLMLDADGGFNVLEFNVRFGDPETQAVLPRVGSSLLEAFQACVEGRLHDSHVRITPETAITVILASGGYPGAFKKNLPIHGVEKAMGLEGCAVFHGGTALDSQGRLVTAGGRVLAVTAIASDLKSASRRVYQAASMIEFEGRHFRTDIGAQALPREG